MSQIRKRHPMLERSVDLNKSIEFKTGVLNKTPQFRVQLKLTPKLKPESA